MSLDERYHPDWPVMSRLVRQEFGNRCARCKLSGDEDAIALQVHHIDENPGNNALENLIPLCSRCHLQIEKEARQHAPYQHQQTELFEDSSYSKALGELRSKALAQQSQQSTKTSEDFEREEREWEQENH